MPDLIERLKAGVPIEVTISANVACGIDATMAEAASEIEQLRQQLADERALFDAVAANGWELQRTLDYAHGHAAPIIGWMVRQWMPQSQTLYCVGHTMDDDPRDAIRDALAAQAKADPAAGKPAKDEAFSGPEDTDSPLMAAAREAGWALCEIVDEIDWTKREQVSEIIHRLAVALREIDTSVEATLLCVIAQIREKSGAGASPMLFELTDAISEKIKQAEERAATATDAHNALLQALHHHTGCNHGLMAIRLLAERQRLSFGMGLEEAAKLVEQIAHESLHASMWMQKFGSAAAAIRALKDQPPPS